MLPNRRRRQPRGRWPEERLYFFTVLGGLLLLSLSYSSFHRKAAERSDALQQLRAAKEARASSATAGGSSSSSSGSGAVGNNGRDTASHGSTAGIMSRTDVENEGLVTTMTSSSSSNRRRGQQQAAHSSGGTAQLQSAGLQHASGSSSTGKQQGQGAISDIGALTSVKADLEVAAELLQYCEQHFGLAWVRRWGAAAQQVCSATRQLQASASGSSGSSSSSDAGQGSAEAAGGGAAAARDSGGGGARGNPGSIAGTDGGSSSGGRGSWESGVTCRFLASDPHLPAASAPYALCNATNLRLDPAKLRRARCPQRRPNYLCISPTYHHYLPGAWSVDCAWPDFSLAAFSKDHQQDIFGAMLFAPDPSSRSDGAEALPSVEALPTLLVTREIKEHANVFHTFTDLLNVYITLELLGWHDQPRQVVMLDAHPPGPLDILWPVAAAGGGPTALAAIRTAAQQQQQQEYVRQGGTMHPWAVRVQDAGGSSSSSSSGSGAGRLLVRRVEEFKGPIVFRHAAFVPPGYASLLFAHLYENSSCPLATTLFAGFRHFLLSSFGLDQQAAAGGAAGMMGAGAAAAGGGAADAGTLSAAGAYDGESSSGSGDGGSTARGSYGVGGSGGGGGGGGGGGDVVTIRLISRRPTASKRRMDRQIANEAELMDMLASLGHSSGGGSGGGSGLQVSASLLDFATLSVEQQLAVVQQTDILIGMHGAALAHALLLPPHAALIELWPQADGIWRCYQNFAQWAGALYRRVANTDPSRLRRTASGDATAIDVAELRQVVLELLPLVQQRRGWPRQPQQQEEGQEL